MKFTTLVLSTVLAFSKASEYHAVMGGYPGTDNKVSGKISVLENAAGALVLNWDVETTFPNGGLHIHTGTSCEDASKVGGHYWKPADAADAWVPIKWNGQKGTVAVADTGLSFADAAGRAVVMHAPDGSRLACGVLAETEAASAKLAEAAKKAAEEKAAKAEALKFCPTDKAKCSDKNGYCAIWAKDNQCITNPRWMVPNCSGSCCPVCNGEADRAAEATCPTDTDTASCKADSRTSCAKWAEKGECEKNAKWMIPNCKASCCDTCNRAANGCPAVKKLCSDDYDTTQCAAWADSGECSKNPKFMNKNCSKSCCSMCAPKPPATVAALATSFAAPVASFAAPASYNFGYNNPYGSYATSTLGSNLATGATLPYSGLNTGVWGR